MLCSWIHGLAERKSFMQTDQEINEFVARGLGWIKTHGPVGIEVPGIERSYATYFIRKTDSGKGIGQEIIVSVPDYCHDIKAAWEVVEHCDMVTYIQCPAVGGKK